MHAVGLDRWQSFPLHACTTTRHMSATGVGEAEKSKHCALASLTPPAAGFHAQRFFHDKAEESPKQPMRLRICLRKRPLAATKALLCVVIHEKDGDESATHSAAAPPRGLG
jgi:hypothetical protein